MNLTVKIRVEEFVEIALGRLTARKLTDDWPIEPSVIKQIVIKYFTTMGIYRVESLRSSTLAYNNVLFILQNSPEIRHLIRKEREAQQDSRKKTSVPI